MDNDGDGFGGPQSNCQCKAAGPYTTDKGGDCADSVWAINPAASEQCNGQDDNCDGITDGMTQSCSNGCSSGTQTCTFGSWGSCNAPSPQCNSGACCDGCNFRSSNYKCQTSPYDTELECQSSSCGAKIIETKTYKYCTGSSSSCGTSNLKSETSTADDCNSNQKCVDSGSNAWCETCAQGCTGNTCITDVCGNGQCESSETPNNCASDCGVVVHNGGLPTLWYKNTLDDDKLSCSSTSSDWWHYGSNGANNPPWWVWSSSCGLPSSSNPTNYQGYNARWKFEIKKAGAYLIDTWLPSSGNMCGWNSTKLSSSVNYILNGPGVASWKIKSQKGQNKALTLWSSVQLSTGTYTVYLYDKTNEGCACNTTPTCVQNIRVVADGLGVKYL